MPRHDTTNSANSRNLRWSGQSARLLILESSKHGNIHTRAAEFAEATGASISINSVSIAQWQNEVFLDASHNGPRTFDGYSLKGNWIPSLVEDGGLADLSKLFDTANNDVWNELQWTDIVPVVRDSISVYDGKVYSIPVDADYIVPAARDDLLEIDQTLDTWEEWVKFAEEQHGRDLNGDNEPDYGACLAKGEGQVHFSVFGALWSIVAPHLQKQGREYGAFFNTTTFEPLWAEDKSSFVKALELYKRLVKVSREGEVTALEAKNLFQSGRCATWLSLPGLVFGVLDTGGIADSTSATMKQFASPGVECASSEECPLAVEVVKSSKEENRLINRAPFYATSGTGLSMSSAASDATRELLLELYTYISAPAQSNIDVILRNTFSDPFRNSQLNELATDRLVEMNGWDESNAESYHEVVSTTLNDEGAALDLRVPGIELYQNSALEAIFPYVYGDDDTLTATDAADDIISSWKEIPAIVFPGSSPEAALGKMHNIYRGQLGLPPLVKMQQIDQTYDKTIVVTSILVLIGFLVAIIAYLWVDRKKEHGDSIWAVKYKELKFGEPPVVVGKSTFGLVLSAEYRGTEVAVKRVIPPLATLITKNDGKDSGSSSIRKSDAIKIKNRRASDFDDIYDEETGMASGVTKLTPKTSRGAYTFSGRFSDTNAKSSLKMLQKFRTQAEYDKLRSEFIIEIRQLSKLRHPCITTVMGAVIDPREEVLLVMEYMQKGSLYDVLHDEKIQFEGGLVLTILRDIAQGARFLHAADPHVIHGDIKSQNILVDSNFRAKITDFGLSCKEELGIATGTPLWTAPELLRGESSNTTASDVYSFGIVLYEAYSRQDPYAGEKLEDVLKDVCNSKINKRPPIPKNMPNKISEIMKCCLDEDPLKRPTFETMDLILKRLNSENVDLRIQNKGANLQGMTNLIYNVFPPHIADALKNGRKVEQEAHECVTIFFSDIVGFTTISQGTTPQKVCKMLDRLYQKFDDLSEKHDIFKTETIGDAYMAISNLVKDQRSDHVKRIAQFSQDAIKAASETLIDEEYPEKGTVQIRVGFHSGPVIADVIGHRLPKYDVFGDTVNTASRMESNSESMRIHCSKTSADLLRNQCNGDIRLKSRGSIKIKGKGEMQTYWVGDDDEEKLTNNSHIPRAA